jgi:hypothetical protein
MMTGGYFRFVLVLVIAAGVLSTLPALSQETPKGTEEEGSHLEVCEGVEPELAKAADVAWRRTVAALTSGREVNQWDVDRYQTYGNACLLAHTQRAAASLTPAQAGKLNPELRNKAVETASRLLALYHEKKGNPGSYWLSRDDRTLVNAFRTAVLAVLVLEKAETARGSASTDPEVTREARQAAERVLAKYNASDGRVEFDPPDVKIIQEFSDALTKAQEKAGTSGKGT